MGWLRWDFFANYDDDKQHDPNDLDFCFIEDWVPVFLIGNQDDDTGFDYGPAVIEGGVWPNNARIRGQHRSAISMAVDCSPLYGTEFSDESLGQAKLINFPVGVENNGPCWNDPDYGGELVCAAGGVRGYTGNNLYRNINNEFYEGCPADFDGVCPRFFTFNCPAGSGKKEDKDKF